MHRVGRAKASLTPTVARLERLDALLPAVAAERPRRRLERDRDALRRRLERKLWGALRSGALQERPRRRRRGRPSEADRHELRLLVQRAQRLLPPADTLSPEDPGTVRRRKLAVRLGLLAA